MDIGFTNYHQQEVVGLRAETSEIFYLKWQKYFGKMFYNYIASKNNKIDLKKYNAFVISPFFKLSDKFT